MCKILKTIRLSVQPRDWIFVKGYRFLSFAKKTSKNIVKRYCLNIVKMIQKTAEATGDLIGNKKCLKNVTIK